MPYIINVLKSPPFLFSCDLTIIIPTGIGGFVFCPGDGRSNLVNCEQSKKFLYTDTNFR